MPDFIDYKDKQAAVALADTLNYEQAADRLGITVFELKSQIEEMESKLCLLIFRVEQGRPSLTEDGRYLIQAFRTVLSGR